MSGAVMVLVVVGIAGYALLSLMPSVNLYIDRTAEVASSGTINTGEGLDLNTTSLDFGVLSPSESNNQTIRVTNLYDEPMVLHMTTSNWDPENATDYMGVSWDAEDKVLLGLAYVDVVFTLTVYSNVTGITNFYFDTTVGGEFLDV